MSADLGRQRTNWTLKLKKEIIQMESRDHFKNGAIPKSHRSRDNKK
jgi:hypothetical protein